MMKWLKHLCDGESAKVNVAPARDRIEDIHCFLDNEELTGENSRKPRSKRLPAADAMDEEKCASGAANVLRCSMSAWTGIRTKRLSTFFMLSTLAQSTLGGLFGLSARCR